VGAKGVRYFPTVGFYARALLLESHGLGLRDLVAFAQAEGITIRVEPASALDDQRWREAELWAPGAEVPVEVDVSRREDTESLLQEELAEFDDELADADEQTPGAIETVRQHLAATNAIVAVRVLASDQEHGLPIGNCVLDWCAQRDRVLFQVDDDGFYDGATLLVAT
jgi:hypothetical protein